MWRALSIRKYAEAQQAQWTRDFFSLSNKGFLLGLNAGKLSVYSFPRRCESQKAHQCWFSIRTIGEAVGMNEHTVRKHIWQLKKYELAAEPRMTACKPLCGPLRGRTESLPPPSGYRPDLGGCSPLFWNGGFPSWPFFKG